MKTNFKERKNQAGFLVADFLFSFILVLGVGFLIFCLSFSLAAVELAQYMVWSSARAYASGNKDELAAKKSAVDKFNNLAAAFPLLTGKGAGSDPWVTMSNPDVGNLATLDQDFGSKISSQADRDNRSANGEFRQPWIGVKSDLNLAIFSGVNFPFLGPITDDRDKFKFPVRAFLLRHPSQQECFDFYGKRYSEGIEKLPDIPSNSIPGASANAYVPIEDNGC